MLYHTVLSAIPDIPDITEPYFEQQRTFFSALLSFIVSFFNRCVELMDSFHIGPLSWWQWVLGMAALTVIVGAIRMLAGTSAPTISGMSSSRSESVSTHKR